MYDLHRFLGEGLFIIYLVLMAVIWWMGRSGRQIPAALTGIGHGLLALQVAVGLILVMEEPKRIGEAGVPWYHPVLGIAAMLAIGLTPVLRKRLGTTMGVVATMGIVAVLALAARLAAM